MVKKEKRTVIITGGNRGIGEYISRAFAENNYRVLIGARTDTGLAEKLGPDVRFKKADVRKEADHCQLVETAKAWTKRVDVYINCAGFSGWRPIGEVDEEFFNTMVDTNLKGTYWGCKVASENLSPGGCIINISSLAAKRGSLNNSVYCLSKFGITAITQSLSKELGPKRIRINAVCPVYIKTVGLMEALNSKHSPAQGADIDEYLQEFIKSNASLGRLPQAEEVAGTCLFLASKQAAAITGQSINVDCGVMPQ